MHSSEANDSLAKPPLDVTIADADAAVQDAPKKRVYKKRINYAAIHKDSLPLTIFPLPTFHPTNPLSFLPLAWTILKQLIAPPKSHPTQKYVGHFSADTRSVHVIDRAHIRALWERGFFGKGTLSRSEPSWMDRERARLEARAQGGQTAEEATRARREERRLFKLERARAEADKIELQRAVEQCAVVLNPSVEAVEIPITTAQPPTIASQPGPTTGSVQDHSSGDQTTNDIDTADIEEIKDQEHLQLTLEEAFFLCFALNVLDIRFDNYTQPANSHSLFNTLRSSTNDRLAPPGMDDTFILNYVVYHHFRSLGWVVRPGVKFSVDYLLYYRGPALSHAEFAVLIMPSYSDPFWSTLEGKALRKRDDQRDWWWFHCISRVQSQVKKTLVLCYVDVPPPPRNLEAVSVKDLLRQYKVREFIVRRWLMNRSRD